MSILELKNVSYVYSKGTPFERVALDDITLSFEKGKITGLIGHTGSGKSTLVSLLNGLNRPTSGTVFFNGADIWEKPREIGKIRYKIGLVMQYPEYQLFDDTVRSDIGFAPRNLGIPSDDIDRLVAEAADFAGVEVELLDKSPFALSGGQKRRVAIAGVLAMSPDVLILDEPAAGLDPRGRREILSGLRRLVKERGTTVILVSHSMEDMAAYCDNVVVMNRSKVFLTGSCRDVFSRSTELAKIGLDSPMVSRISDILLGKGIALEGELYSLEGLKNAITEYSRRKRNDI